MNTLIRSKSGEKLSYDNIERVISQLEKDNPITKKEACGMLNIRYNTTRLQKIIDDHLETKAFRETRKNQSSVIRFATQNFRHNGTSSLEAIHKKHPVDSGQLKKMNTSPR